MNLTRDDSERMIEYACHDGNRAMANSLTGHAPTSRLPGRQPGAASHGSGEAIANGPAGHLRDTPGGREAGYYVLSVLSPPSTITFSTTPPPARRNAAAS